MPISSHQISGMIGGQQAMFGNFSSYSQQISPGSRGMPTYSNPMAGVQMNAANPIELPGIEDVGAHTMSAVGNIGLPALGTAAMLGGSFLPGALGRGIGALDPFSAGLGGFARGAGLRSGGAGIMSNLGRIASGGVGSIARAGIAGVGGAAAAAALPMAIGGMAHFGVGNMVEGAQFAGQVGNFLDTNFRQLNPVGSQTGFGFGRHGKAEIADTLREMGTKEILSTPQEMMRLMQAGTGMGIFRAVQDAKQFSTKFKEMVGALKEVATTMNTTLEGAVPFFAQARQMGFWTPQDIARNAQQVKQTASATGMSVAQTQQMMSQGAQMARQVGARGYAGAQGMAQSMQLVGGAVRGGVLSEEQVAEMTGGLQGAEGIQALSGQMQASATRFASGRTARWLLASLGRNNFQNLDQGKLSALVSGSMTLGSIGGSARGNINRQGAFNFVQNEQRLREELIRRGPEAQFGLIRSVIGGHLYDDSNKGQYISRRIIQRFMGGSAQQADATAKMLREMPQISRENQQRAAAAIDQEERNRNELMNHSWEGLKRKMGNWWKGFQEPFQKLGQEMSEGISKAFQYVSDRLFSRPAARYAFRGFEPGALQALQLKALGGPEGEKAYAAQFASQREMAQFTTRTEETAKSSWFSKLRPTANARERALGQTPDAILAASSGVITGKGATQLGFGGVDEANKSMRAAREEMSGTDFQAKSFWLSQHKDLSGFTGQNRTDRLGKLMVEEIKAGRMGGDALKSLVESGGDQAVMRLAAAQTDSQRGGAAGLDFSGMAKKVNALAGMSSEKQEVEMSRMLESQEDVIAKVASKSKGIYDGGFSGTEVRELMENKKIRGIMTTLGNEKATPEERADAMKELAAAAASGDFKPHQQKLLHAMTNPNSPHAKEMAGAMNEMGSLLRVRNTLAAGATIKQRMQRFKDAMGGDVNKIMKGLTQITTKHGGSLGAAVRDLTEDTFQTPGDFQEKISALVEASAGADPEQAARAAQMLRGFPGGEEMVAAIEEGAKAGGAARMLTKRQGTISQRVQMAQTFAQQMGVGMQITTKELKALEAGGKGAEKAHTAIINRMGKDAPPALKQHAAALLTAIRNKSETELYKLGTAGGAARALSLMGTPETDLFHKKTLEIRRSLGAGQLGSPAGMHTTLNDIKVILAEISKKGFKGEGLGVGEKPENEKTP